MAYMMKPPITGRGVWTFYRTKSGRYKMSKQSFFADDGWAIWIDGNDTSTIYLNDWLNPKGKSFVDIAVHTRKIRQAHSLNIYIPFEITADEIEDISLLLQDSKLLCATFNATCIIDYKKNACTSELAYNGKTVDLVHLSELGYTLTSLADGTLLYADFEKLQDFLANDEAYLIFRIPHKSLDLVFSPRLNVKRGFARLRDLFTTPVNTEKYGYSVRINELRRLPSEISRTGAFHRQKLKRALISVCAGEEYEVNDQNCFLIRRLEETLYRSYVPDGFSCEGAIIYQWEQTRETNLRGQFNFYFSIMRNSISSPSMLIYIILLALIGTAGSAIYDLLKLLLG